MSLQTFLWRSVEESFEMPGSGSQAIPHLTCWGASKLISIMGTLICSPAVSKSSPHYNIFNVWYQISLFKIAFNRASPSHHPSLPPIRTTCFCLHCQKLGSPAFGTLYLHLQVCSVSWHSQPCSFLCELEASLISIVSSRIARATYRDPVSKQTGS